MGGVRCVPFCTMRFSQNIIAKIDFQGYFVYLLISICAFSIQKDVDDTRLSGDRISIEKLNS